MKKLKCIFFLTVIAAFHFISFGLSSQIHHLKRRPVKIINFEQGLLNNETTGVIAAAGATALPGYLLLGEI